MQLLTRHHIWANHKVTLENDQQREKWWNGEFRVQWPERLQKCWSGHRTRNSPNQYFSCCWLFLSLTSWLVQKWSLVGTCMASSFRSFYERNEKQLKTRHYSYSTASSSLLTCAIHSWKIAIFFEISGHPWSGTTLATTIHRFYMYLPHFTHSLCMMITVEFETSMANSQNVKNKNKIQN